MCNIERIIISNRCLEGLKSQLVSFSVKQIILTKHLVGTEKPSTHMHSIIYVHYHWIYLYTAFKFTLCVYYGGGGHNKRHDNQNLDNM